MKATDLERLGRIEAVWKRLARNRMRTWQQSLSDEDYELLERGTVAWTIDDDFEALPVEIQERFVALVEAGIRAIRYRDPDAE